MPEILPTWKVEIRRIMVSGQLDQKKKKKMWDFILTEKKLGVVACTCHPSYVRNIK
jgi:hypothetical protein